MLLPKLVEQGRGDVKCADRERDDEPAIIDRRVDKPREAALEHVEVFEKQVVQDPAEHARRPLGGRHEFFALLAIRCRLFRRCAGQGFEEVRRHQGRERHRHQVRCDDGSDHRARHTAEPGAHVPGHLGHGDQHDDKGEGSGGNGVLNFLRTANGGLPRRHAALDMPSNYLHNDDRVVEEFADDEDETHRNAEVLLEPQHVNYEKAKGDGRRQDRGRDQGGAEFPQEQQHDEPGKCDGEEELRQCVPVVEVHVEGLVKDHIEAKTGILILQQSGQLFRFGRDRPVIAGRFGLDSQPDRRLRVVEEVAVLGCDGISHLRDICQVDDLALDVSHGEPRQPCENRLFAKLVWDTDLDLPVAIEQGPAATIEISGIDRLANVQDR